MEKEFAAVYSCKADLPHQSMTNGAIKMTPWVMVLLALIRMPLIKSTVGALVNNMFTSLCFFAVRVPIQLWDAEFNRHV